MAIDTGTSNASKVSYVEAISDFIDTIMPGDYFGFIKSGKNI